MKKKILILLISLLFISFAAQAVISADDDFKLVDAFDAVKGFDVAGAYAKYPYLVDSIIYFIFFIGVSQFTLAKRFEGSGGKAVIIAFGLALSISMSYWSFKVGFTLARLGPLAGIVLAIAFSIMIWRMFTHSEGNKWESIWIGFIAVFVGLHMFIPPVITAIKANKYGAMIYGIMNILFIVALVMMISNFFRGAPAGAEGGDKGLADGLGIRGSKSDKKAKKEDEDENKAEEDETVEQRKTIKNTLAEIQEIYKIDKEVQKWFKRLAQFHGQPINQPALARLKYDFDAAIDDINADLTDLVELDERLQEDAQKMYEIAKSRISKGGKYKDYKKMAQRLLRECQAVNFIETRVGQVITILTESKNWGNIIGSTTPVATADLRVPLTKLRDASREISDIYKRLNDFYNGLKSIV